jgi:uroporphyrinogen decarboxylase
MRQAGRYMQEYQRLRQKYDFLTLCKTPELATQVSLQPINKFNMDGIILFSDILTPLEPMGVNLAFSDAKGPALDTSKLKQNLTDLRYYHIPEKLDYVPQTIKMLKQEKPHKALIGFAGAPFTLATYLMEKEHKKNFHFLRIAIAQDPDYVKKILEILARQMGQYLAWQLIAGADLVQLFDSWAGNLPSQQFSEFALSYQNLCLEVMEQELANNEEGRKRLQAKDYHTILFIKNFSGPWSLLEHSHTDILSIDDSHPLSQVRAHFKDTTPLQGNLSPYDLFLPQDKLRQAVRSLSQELASTGHIFNLGHGVLPQTPEQNIFTVMETLHEAN